MVSDEQRRAARDKLATDPKVRADAPSGAVLAHPLEVEISRIRLIEELVFIAYPRVSGSRVGETKEQYELTEPPRRSLGTSEVTETLAAGGSHDEHKHDGSDPNESKRWDRWECHLLGDLGWRRPDEVKLYTYTWRSTAVNHIQ